jgi:poly-beta-1,6-N-acetyl-D-glucosamine synthase
MIHIHFHYLAYLIAAFGLINLVRMGLMRLGSDRFRHSRQVFPPPATLPTVSIIIPARNESSTIIRAVMSVLTTNYPESLKEVIVVDNNSTDNTARLVTNLIEKNPSAPLTLIEEKNPGKAHALNTGIKLSRSNIVICLDADSYLDSNAIKNLVPHFTDPTVTAVAANVKIIPRSGLLALIQRFEYLICYQMKRAEYHYNINYIVGGIGSAFRRSAIQYLGYYDTDTITEDIDLTLKIIDQGNTSAPLRYAPDVVAFTEPVQSFKDLVKQRFRWKYGRYQTFLKHRSLFFSTSSKHTPALSWLYLPYALFGDLAFLLEPLLVGYILFIVLAFHDIITLISTLSLLTAYHLFMIWGEDTLSRKEQAFYSLLAPFMYFALYLVSLAEYAALLKSLLHLPRLKQSLAEGCSWVHVRRALP